jgi:hypothetical protein
MALAVQLQAGKNTFYAFLYQACVCSVLSPRCSCGLGHQIDKHIIICCRHCSAARHALRDNQGHLPDFKQLLTTLTGLQKVTKWVIEREILCQYHWARGFLTHQGLLPQQTTELDYNLGTAEKSNLIRLQMDKLKEDDFFPLKVLFTCN